MVINNIMDIIESHGFKWNGSCYTCGFYRIRESNCYYYIEKYKFYKNHRAVYEDIFSLFVRDDQYSWAIYHVADGDFIKFKNEMKKATRDTKLKKIDGFFKYSEDHYSDLHSRNK